MVLLVRPVGHEVAATGEVCLFGRASRGSGSSRLRDCVVG